MLPQASGLKRTSKGLALEFNCVTCGCAWTNTEPFLHKWFSKVTGVLFESKEVKELQPASWHKLIHHHGQELCPGNALVELSPGHLAASTWTSPGFGYAFHRFPQLRSDVCCIQVTRSASVVSIFASSPMDTAKRYSRPATLRMVSRMRTSASASAWTCGKRYACKKHIASSLFFSNNFRWPKLLFNSSLRCFLNSTRNSSLGTRSAKRRWRLRPG